MPKKNYTIKVFTVFDPPPATTAHLEYICHNDDDLNDVSPGRRVPFKPNVKVRWQCMSQVSMAIDFNNGSPFVSKKTHLVAAAPDFVTAKETIKQDVPTSTGANPGYKYTVTVQGVPPDDPDVIIDLSGGGGAKPKPKPKPKPKAKAKPKK